MLEIDFYTKTRKHTKKIYIPHNIYAWLTRSEFSKIGRKRNFVDLSGKDDAEKQIASLIRLNQNNRKLIKDFLEREIIESSYFLSKNIKTFGSDSNLIKEKIANKSETIESLRFESWWQEKLQEILENNDKLFILHELLAEIKRDGNAYMQSI